MKEIINNVNKDTIQYGIDYFTKNYGSFKVLNYEYTGNNHIIFYRIIFNLTNFIKIVSIYSIIYGNIKDPYYPSIFNVACCGQAIGTIDGKHSTREYTLWYSMIARCYNPNCTEYKYYGAIGVIVCVKWLCFEYFLQDLPLIPGYELWKNSTIPREYQLEKDYNQLNSDDCKIYSLETCFFATQYNNKMIKSLSNASNYSSKYIGVNRVEYENKNVSYESYIWVNNKKISLGYYKIEEAAAQARDSAAIQFYGRDAVLNNVNGISSSDMDANCTSRKDCSKYYLRRMYRLTN